MCSSVFLKNEIHLVRVILFFSVGQQLFSKEEAVHGRPAPTPRLNDAWLQTGVGKGWHQESLEN